MTGSSDARAAVMARIADLVTEWPVEQAIQFEGAWWTWGGVARVVGAVAEILDRHGVPADGPVAIVMRQRPALVATEVAVLAAGRTAVLLSPLQPDALLLTNLSSNTASVVIAHSSDWQRVGFAERVLDGGMLGVEVDDGGSIVVRSVPSTLAFTPPLLAAVTVLTSGTTGPPKRLPVAWETFVDLGGGPAGREPKSARGASRSFRRPPRSRPIGLRSGDC